MKVILGGFNAKVGNKSFTYPACGMQSFNNITNLNGKKLVNFALGRTMAITATSFEHKNIHKIEHLTRLDIF